VIGDAVNVAARLEQLNKDLGTEILASATVADRLPAELRGLCQARGAIAVKGRAAQVEVFSL
jgi:class 3 adenylate cyclase